MNDLVWRQDAIDALGEEPEVWDEWVDEYAMGQREQWRSDRLSIEALPSAVKHGRWMFYERREPLYDICGVETWGIAYRCSDCGFIHTVIEDFGHYAFCPSCGARMAGDTDETN